MEEGRPLSPLEEERACGSDEEPSVGHGMPEMTAGTPDHRRRSTGIQGMGCITCDFMLGGFSQSPGIY